MCINLQEVKSKQTSLIDTFIQEKLVVLKAAIVLQVAHYTFAWERNDL